MIDPIWVKAVIKALVLPPTGPLLVALAGIVMLGRYPRGGRALAAAGLALLMALSMPVVSAVLTRLVSVAPALVLEQVKSAQALVILGGGTRRDAVEFGGDTLGRLTLERVRYGARVARQTGLPVLVTGGSVYGGEPEAKLMREALEQEFGVPVRWAEARSRTTHENAVFSAEVLREAAIRRVVLVAHGMDMRRAVAEFTLQGIDVIPAPTVIAGIGAVEPLDFLPSMAGLHGSYYAIYELLANAVLWASRSMR